MQPRYSLNTEKYYKEYLKQLCIFKQDAKGTVTNFLEKLWSKRDGFVLRFPVLTLTLALTTTSSAFLTFGAYPTHPRFAIFLQESLI